MHVISREDHVPGESEQQHSSPMETDNQKIQACDYGIPKCDVTIGAGYNQSELVGDDSYSLNLNDNLVITKTRKDAEQLLANQRPLQDDQKTNSKNKTKYQRKNNTEKISSTFSAKKFDTSGSSDASDLNISSTPCMKINMIPSGNQLPRTPHVDKQVGSIGKSLEVNEDEVRLENHAYDDCKRVELENRVQNKTKNSSHIITYDNRDEFIISSYNNVPENIQTDSRYSVYIRSVMEWKKLNDQYLETPLKEILEIYEKVKKELKVRAKSSKIMKSKKGGIENRSSSPLKQIGVNQVTSKATKNLKTNSDIETFSIKGIFSTKKDINNCENISKKAPLKGKSNMKKKQAVNEKIAFEEKENHHGDTSKKISSRIKSTVSKSTLDTDIACTLPVNTRSAIAAPATETQHIKLDVSPKKISSERSIIDSSTTSLKDRNLHISPHKHQIASKAPERIHLSLKSNCKTRTNLNLNDDMNTKEISVNDESAIVNGNSNQTAKTSRKKQKPELHIKKSSKKSTLTTTSAPSRNDPEILDVALKKDKIQPLPNQIHNIQDTDTLKKSASETSINKSIRKTRQRDINLAIDTVIQKVSGTTSMEVADININKGKRTRGKSKRTISVKPNITNSKNVQSSNHIGMSADFETKGPNSPTKTVIERKKSNQDQPITARRFRLKDSKSKIPCDKEVKDKLVPIKLKDSKSERAIKLSKISSNDESVQIKEDTIYRKGNSTASDKCPKKGNNTSVNCLPAMGTEIARKDIQEIGFSLRRSKRAHVNQSRLSQDSIYKEAKESVEEKSAGFVKPKRKVTKTVNTSKISNNTKSSKMKEETFNNTDRSITSNKFTEESPETLVNDTPARETEKSHVNSQKTETTLRRSKRAHNNQDSKFTEIDEDVENKLEFIKHKPKPTRSKKGPLQSVNDASVSKQTLQSNDIRKGHIKTVQDAIHNTPLKKIKPRPKSKTAVGKSHDQKTNLIEAMASIAENVPPTIFNQIQDDIYETPVKKVKSRRGARL